MLEGGLGRGHRRHKVFNDLCCTGASPRPGEAQGGKHVANARFQVQQQQQQQKTTTTNWTHYFARRLLKQPIWLDHRYRTDLGPYNMLPVLCDAAGSRDNFCTHSAGDNSRPNHRHRTKPQRCCTGPSSFDIGGQAISVACRCRPYLNGRRISKIPSSRSRHKSG
jgi:hypothetical protein